MKIDFYVLQATSSQQSLYFACQLIEKFCSLQTKNIYIHMNTREEAEKLDALLWTYKDDSFIPHQLYDPTHRELAQVQIGFHLTRPINGILFNLHLDIPSFYKQFDHIIEIVFDQHLSQQKARERYKQYRGEGHEINTIKESQL